MGEKRFRRFEKVLDEVEEVKEDQSVGEGIEERRVNRGRSSGRRWRILVVVRVGRGNR